jgi:hypothetical protein
MLGLLVRLVAVFLLVRFFFRLLQSFLRPATRSSAGARPPAAARDLVRDRVCNTFLPRDRALTAVVDGREEHFCSAACRDQALRVTARAAS